MTAMINPSSITFICLSMAFIAAGGSLTLGIFGMKALETYPDMKGTASSGMTAIRQFLAFTLVFISEMTFDGTIVPVAIILFAYISVAAIWYGIIQYNERSISTKAASPT